jgi:hypothetical protein
MFCIIFVDSTQEMCTAGQVSTFAIFRLLWLIVAQAARIREFLEAEVSEGISYQRMAVVGVGQGGSLGLYVALVLPMDAPLGGLAMLGGVCPMASRFEVRIPPALYVGASLPTKFPAVCVEFALLFYFDYLARLQFHICIFLATVDQCYSI